MAASWSALAFSTLALALTIWAAAVLTSFGCSTSFASALAFYTSWTALACSDLANASSFASTLFSVAVSSASFYTDLCSGAAGAADICSGEATALCGAAGALCSGVTGAAALCSGVASALCGTATAFFSGAAAALCSTFVAAFYIFEILICGSASSWAASLILLMLICGASLFLVTDSGFKWAADERSCVLTGSTLFSGATDFSSGFLIVTWWTSSSFNESNFFSASSLAY